MITHSIDIMYNGANSIYFEDIDGNGMMDLVSNARYDDLSWWKNDNGSGMSWSEHIISSTFGGNSVHSEDIDSDGDMDIIGASWNGHNVSWWENVDGSGTLHFPCSLQGILSENDSYFQYRAILQTTESSISPVLEDITVTWNPLGTEEGEHIELELLSFTPNPASAPEVRFNLPEPASVDISIFDLSGRLVSEIHEDEYTSGFHNVLIGDLSTGIYFCRMISGNFATTECFVVIE